MCVLWSNLAVAGSVEQLLSVVLNGRVLHHVAVVIITEKRALLMHTEDVAVLLIQHPQQVTHAHGLAFYNLSVVPGIHYRIDPHQAKLYLSVPTDAFMLQRYTLKPHPVIPQKRSFSMYLNYDALVQHSDGLTASSAMFDGHVFNRLGTGQMQYLLQQQAGHVQAIRLLSRWTRDQPQRMTRFVAGNTTTDGGAWGNSVLLGGLQWQRNFTLQPGFASYPLPTVSGSARLPSTADVYINNTLAYQHHIRPGPFTLDNVLVTAQGMSKS